jgi:hypothetical protein
MLKCSACKNVYPIDNFNLIAEGRRSKKPNARIYAYWCKKCAEKSRKNKKRLYVPKTKEEGWRVHLRKRYNITPDRYNEILEEQGGVCFICKGKETSVYSKLAVDHCHATMKIRGLLCSHCNKGLGNFRDKIELLEAAINYLKRDVNLGDIVC